jgi:hypothetical protein
VRYMVDLANGGTCEARTDANGFVRAIVLKGDGWTRELEPPLGGTFTLDTVSRMIATSLGWNDGEYNWEWKPIVEPTARPTHRPKRRSQT